MDALNTAEPRPARRRRTLLGLAVGGVLAALLTVAGSMLAPDDVVEASELVVSPAAAGSPTLDGYWIGALPDGVKAYRRDSSSTCLVAAAMRECRNPRTGDPIATNSLRRYDKDGSAWLWIGVLRPLATTPTADRARITRWLVDWQTTGSSEVSRFDAPAGPARVIATTGSDVTAHSVVILADGGVVITIGGNAGLSVADLTAVAEHLTPTR